MPKIYSPNPLIHWAHSAWRRFDMEPPVDLAQISEFLNLPITRDTLAPGMFGLYCRFETGDSLAVIEAALPGTEQRFVWAHEIAHHILSKKQLGVIEIHCSCENQDTPLERDCDFFAKHLLMPEHYVRLKAKEWGHPQENRIGSLASAFGVSMETMSDRLRELGLHRSSRRKQAVSWEEMNKQCMEYEEQLIAGLCNGFRGQCGG